MNLSGVNTIQYKSFYPSDEFSIDMFVGNIDDFRLNLLGSGYTGFINFQSGKITDSYNRLLSSYNVDTDIDIRIAFKTGLYSLWDNGDLVIADKRISNNTYSSLSSITGLSFISYSSQNKDITVDFYRTLPTVTFSNLDTDDLLLYTGTINYDSVYGVINSINPERGSVVSFTQSFTNESVYVLSGLGMYNGDTLQIDFDLNAGKFTENIEVIYTEPTVPTGSISVSIDGLTNFVYTEDDIIFNKQYSDFNITSSWPVETNIEVYLQYIGRNGQVPVSGSGTASGTFSGYVNGSGYAYSDNLTGIITNYGITGIGTGRVFTYPTGILTYEYIATATGYEAGKLSTGVIYGELTGIVGPGSGRYLFNQSVIGTPSVSVWDGGINSSPVGLYTGSVFQEIILGRYINFFSTGDFYGTGFVQLSGSISGFNLITGEPVQFNRDSDDYWAIYNNYFNYAEQVGYSGEYLRSTFNLISGGLFSYYGRLIYNKEGFDGVSDNVKLIVRNEYEEKEFNIVGYSL